MSDCVALLQATGRGGGNRFMANAGLAWVLRRPRPVDPRRQHTATRTRYVPSGADDQKPTRTPASGMISLAAPLALRQRLFSVWATLTSRIGQLLGERRGVDGVQRTFRGLCADDSVLGQSQ
jgi:hypothetical protein